MKSPFSKAFVSRKPTSLQINVSQQDLTPISLSLEGEEDATIWNMTLENIFEVTFFPCAQSLEPVTRSVDRRKREGLRKWRGCVHWLCETCCLERERKGEKCLRRRMLNFFAALPIPQRWWVFPSQPPRSDIAHLCRVRVTDHLYYLQSMCIPPPSIHMPLIQSWGKTQSIPISYGNQHYTNQPRSSKKYLGQRDKYIQDNKRIHR